MFPVILGALVSINFLRTEEMAVLWSLFSIRSLIRSLVKFFPKDLVLPRTGRDISGERKVMYFLLFSPNSAFFISYPLASINARNSE